MPLTFNTVNKGEIPIGFFNIDSDMILIKNYFIFASDFCEWIGKLVSAKDDFDSDLEIYIIENLDDIGHLMGAISGVIFTGFIGEVYKKYPFPAKREDFKQKPEGFKTQDKIEKIINNFAEKKKVKIKISKQDGTICIGEYIFSKEQFHEILMYVWRGGMPEWKNGIRPEYVNTMMKNIIASRHWLFKAEIFNENKS
jgi:hypothetical protein